jgi:hypothetical protein
MYICDNWYVLHVLTDDRRPSDGQLQSATRIVRLKRGGTSLREKAGFKGKQANEVGTQLMKRDRSQLAQRYYHVTTTMCTLRLLAPD